MGEGISESIVQGNNNLSNQNDESIHESEAEEHKSEAEEHESEADEQQVDHNPVSNNTGPIMTMSYGRVSHAPT